MSAINLLKGSYQTLPLILSKLTHSPTTIRKPMVFSYRFLMISGAIEVNESISNIIIFRVFPTGGWESPSPPNYYSPSLNKSKFPPTK